MATQNKTKKKSDFKRLPPTKVVGFRSMTPIHFNQDGTPRQRKRPAKGR